MNFKVLKNKLILQEVWYFLSVIIVLTIILELFFPNIVLIYINPLFLLVIWIILAIYLLIKK